VVGAVGRVGANPAAELRIRDQHDVAAAAIVGHLLQERGHGRVERLQQTLLGFAFVGVGVETAQLYPVDPRRDAGLYRVGDHAQLSGKRIAARRTGFDGGIGAISRPGGTLDDPVHS
jgi:hypothetical protein